jgi:hypothetical protein
MNESDKSGATRDEEHIVREAKALFDQSVQELDAQTLSRLNRGRQAALAEVGKKSGPALSAGQWLPAAGVAAAAVVAVVLWNGETTVEPISSTASVTDFELLLAEDSFEMLQDLEFYAWMELEADTENDDTDANVG